MNTQKILDVITRSLETHLGIPARNRRSVDPLTVLIGTVLSQNTNDKNSFRAYSELRRYFPEWDMINSADEKVIADLIRPAGLVKQKTETILKIIALARNENKSMFDENILRKMSDKEIIFSLTTINGVGVKTAACVLLFAIHRNVCPVDTHVHRILNRLKVVTTSSPEKTFWQIFDHIPKNKAHSFHTNLIRLGRAICKPQSPACANCPLQKKCGYENKRISHNREVRSNAFMLLDVL